MDNVLIVVEDLDAVIVLFVELGMELEGTGPVEVGWDAVIGSKGPDRTSRAAYPGAEGRIELAMFHAPDPISVEPRDAPANTLGIRRIMFAVDDIDEVVERLRSTELNSWRVGAVRGPVPAVLCPWPGGHVVGLAQQLS
ncbi:MAG: hypothetical protein R2789_07740 [Microthrixaceae bacterium]